MSVLVLVALMMVELATVNICQDCLTPSVD